jgi:hypothetical protein
LKQFKDNTGTLQTDGNGGLLDLPTPADPSGLGGFSSDKPTAQEQYRNAYFATTFRALGDVLHLNQDMAQPQHTRNEIHPMGQRKFYEAYIDARARVDTGARTFRSTAFGTPITDLQSLNFVPTAIPTFNHYSDYWSTAPGGNVATGYGMADYSNRGFFTAAHNLGEGTYSLPSSDPSEYTRIASQDADGNIWGYLDQSVSDLINGESRPIHKTVESVWKSALLAVDFEITPQDPVYTLDRATFDDFVSLLIPRAVAYSTGLLNYFFRGQLEISLPDEGVYAVLDHALASGNDATVVGFSKLKVKIRNTTPPGTDPQGNVSPETMDASGTLVAVAKFHRNQCYAADLSGEDGAQNADGTLRNDWKM